MVKFKKANETADNDIAKLEDVSEVDSMRKPSWVNLTQLENNDSILDKLVFKVNTLGSIAIATLFRMDKMKQTSL